MPWVFERISQPQTFDEIYVYIDTFTYSKVWYGMVWIKEKQTKSPEGECCVLVLLSRLQLLLPIYKSIKKKKKQNPLGLGFTSPRGYGSENLKLGTIRYNFRARARPLSYICMYISFTNYRLLWI